MRTSKALPVKKWLRDKLAAVPELAGVQLTYGYPSGKPERSWIALADIEWSSSEWVLNRSRAEEFAVTVVFNVQTYSGNSEEAEDATWAMAAHLEQLLFEDPSMGGLCVTSGYRAQRLKSWPIDQGGYEAQYEIEVVATCRP